MSDYEATGQTASALIRLREAMASGEREEAAAQARHLLVEWEEVRILYPEFLRRTIAELRSRVEDETPVDRFEAELRAEFGEGYEAKAVQDQLDSGVERLVHACEAGTATRTDVDALIGFYLVIHDRWRDQLSAAIDLGEELLGEERIGELWAAVQAKEIESYDRYDRSKRPWSESFEEVVEGAFLQQHGHLCGPKFDGGLEVFERDDHVEVRFSPCGTGGRIRDEDRFGVTQDRYDWAWNKEGVCYYCVHCCVLQQKEPIDNLGMPVRVIDPPTSPGDSCSWKIYRSPELIPDSAYEAVGRKRPEPSAE